MILVFVHQNFPGQYRHLATYYGAQPGTRVLFVTQSILGDIPGVERIVYDAGNRQPRDCHPYAVEFDGMMRNGTAVAEVFRQLRESGIVPDLICGHNGWGETLFVKDVFPDVPLLSYFEFYYHASGADVGFDPEYSLDIQADPLRLRARNATALLGLDAADWGNTPTSWQRALHPPEFRNRLTVLHEGVDTDRVQPDPTAWIALERDGVRLTRQDEVVTYIARNLEPYRGFHIFMRAAAQILRRRPKARIVVIGGDEISYGAALPNGLGYRDAMLRELGPSLDWSRVHFLGRLPFEVYLKVLQISSAHVYLTYPFVLSWSFVEALAAGCAMIGSATSPVMEVLRHDENGLLVDFFSPTAIADAVDTLLDEPSRATRLRAAARRTATEQFDLHARILPLWDTLFRDLIARRRPALFPADATAAHPQS